MLAARGGRGRKRPAGSQNADKKYAGDWPLPNLISIEP